MWSAGGDMDQPEAIRGKIFFDGAKKFFRHCPAGRKEGLEIPGQGGAGQSLPWLARILH